MARNTNPKIYLGYEDERVTEKHRSLVNFTTNKIGGKPDFPCGKTSVPTPRCNLCRLQQVLALQIYAPLENSKYHRTLYIFTCVNPNCWNQNESWTCIRVQSVEDTGTLTSASSSVRAESATSWLSDADDWGNDSNDNTSEQNGNNVPFYSKQFSLSTWNESLDDQDLNNDFSNLRVDDPNANSPTGVESPTVGGGGGAVGRLDSPHASAEIEGEESEVICIDTPTKPQCDLVTLLHEVTPLPVQHVDSKEVLLTFTEIFISVEEEECNSYVPQHVRDLISEYEQSNPESIPNSPVNSGPAKDTETTLEKYEKGIPVHGDEMFHDFMSRLQMNPGQILRYSRDNSAALLPYPLGGSVGRCKHCGDELTFELQILPTIIPKLKLDTQQDQDFQIEFGTVLIYACLRSCWSSTDSYREEPVVVQAEKLF